MIGGGGAGGMYISSLDELNFVHIAGEPASNYESDELYSAILGILYFTSSSVNPLKFLLDG